MFISGYKLLGRVRDGDINFCGNGVGGIVCGAGGYWDKLSYCVSFMLTFRTFRGK